MHYVIIVYWITPIYLQIFVLILIHRKYNTMHVLSFLALAILAHSQTYLYEDAHITLTPLSTGSLSTTHTSIDQCGRIVLRNSSIYHLSKEGIYQLWTTGNLSASKNTLNLSSSLNSSLIDFDVSAN